MPVESCLRQRKGHHAHKDILMTSKSRIGTPLTQFLGEEEKKFPNSTGHFTGLLGNIASVTQQISTEVNRAGLIDILGATGEVNVQGEEVQKLDDLANNIIVGTFKKTGNLAGMASEEEDSFIKIPDEYEKDKYLLLFDPLDGSSNIDVNVSVGTIFSVLEHNGSGEVTEADFLQPGNKQVCAGYVIYGSSTILVYTTGAGVHGFTLDNGEFLLSHEDIKTPSKGKIYSVNESNSHKWEEVDGGATERFVDKFKADGYTGRYIGSFVADFHRNLIKGGIFSYPADSKNKDGKLRILYEANPLSFLVEQAGGLATTGKEDIMNITPKGLHERVPVIIGSKEDVELAKSYF